MLNLYNYYDDYESLPLYKELGSAIPLLSQTNRQLWGGQIQEEDLKPVIEIIKSSPHYSYVYAVDIIGGRWPDGENAIKTDPHLALRYIKQILTRDPNWPYKSGRWPDAEPYIMRNGYIAYQYASDILKVEPTWNYPKGLWPDAEPYIMKDSAGAYMYAAYALKRRWESAEPYIMKDEWTWGKYKAKFGIE
jgi:hypothetical protein